MATYSELEAFLSSSERAALYTRVVAANKVKATAITNATDASAAARDWARNALNNEAMYTAPIFTYVVYDSASMTTAQIADLTDAETQAKVDKIVDALYSA